MNYAARAYAYLVIVALLSAGAARSQPPRPDATENAKILAYIHGAWNTLSRSMTDCRSLIDPKLKASAAGESNSGP